MQQNMNSHEFPATIDVNPEGGEPLASVIWLHGLGANGNDFVPIVDQFDLGDNHQVRFVFPHAPYRSITVNGGMRMRAWYDIAEINLAFREDDTGIKESEELINRLISREADLGVPHHKIILAGFSQGGAISLYTGLRYPKQLGGIIVLSAYLPLASTLPDERNHANQQTPILMAHGLFDPIVPLMLGEMSRQQLEGLGYPVEWHAYSMPHTVHPEEIRDIGIFLKKII